jgi:hypothetical protein
VRRSQHQERRLILPESDPEWLGSSGTCATIKGGTTIERDTASLSADRKELTLTKVAYRPGERDSTDVLQFERK